MISKQCMDLLEDRLSGLVLGTRLSVHNDVSILGKSHAFISFLSNTILCSAILKIASELVSQVQNS